MVNVSDISIRISQHTSRQSGETDQVCGTCHGGVLDVEVRARYDDLWGTPVVRVPIKVSSNSSVLTDDEDETLGPESGDRQEGRRSPGFSRNALTQRNIIPRRARTLWIRRQDFGKFKDHVHIDTNISALSLVCEFVGDDISVEAQRLSTDLEAEVDEWRQQAITQLGTSLRRIKQRRRRGQPIFGQGLIDGVGWWWKDTYELAKDIGVAIAQFAETAANVQRQATAAFLIGTLADIREQNLNDPTKLQRIEPIIDGVKEIFGDDVVDLDLLYRVQIAQTVLYAMINGDIDQIEKSLGVLFSYYGYARNPLSDLLYSIIFRSTRFSQSIIQLICNTDIIQKIGLALLSIMVHTTPEHLIYGTGFTVGALLPEFILDLVLSVFAVLTEGAGAPFLVARISAVTAKLHTLLRRTGPIGRFLVSQIDDLVRRLRPLKELTEKAFTAAKPLLLAQRGSMVNPNSIFVSLVRHAKRGADDVPWHHGPKPRYVHRAHHDPASGQFRGRGASVTELLPDDAESAFRKAVPTPSDRSGRIDGSTWWSINDEGRLYRYQVDHLDITRATDPNLDYRPPCHWNGSFERNDPDVPGPIRRMFSEAWRRSRNSRSQ